jgi:hypothetical protein
MYQKYHCLVCFASISYAYRFCNNVVLKVSPKNNNVILILVIKMLSCIHLLMLKLGKEINVLLSLSFGCVGKKKGFLLIL